MITSWVKGTSLFMQEIVPMLVKLMKLNNSWIGSLTLHSNIKYSLLVTTIGDLKPTTTSHLNIKKKVFIIFLIIWLRLTVLRFTEVHGNLNSTIGHSTYQEEKNSLRSGLKSLMVLTSW